jgi:hypothetical protein
VSALQRAAARRGSTLRLGLLYYARKRSRLGAA